ncbi:uncharacterized protein LOC124154580 isoform X2 [Ischnura elegans]|uniref:uncharacterized protein LOC124154580 isoform X2 n=1 Tax=Ischnura elegans TaxID=197161 RepID=UPI001ED895FD|nr:uncharacterized protein LOC124154580 isoform X2 [Ischnura elegans]
MDNTSDVGDNQPKPNDEQPHGSEAADEIDSERKEVTEDTKVAEEREQKEENPNVDEAVEQNTEKSSNVEAAEEPGEVPSVVGEAEQSGERPGVDQAGDQEGEKPSTTEAAEQEHGKSSNVEGEDKPGGEPGVVGGGEAEGDKPRVDEAGDQKGEEAGVPGTAQQQGDMPGITTTREQTTAEGTMLGDGQVMETKEGGKGKKGKGGKKGKKKKKKKGKKKKKKGKKLSKKELALLKQQLKELEHQQKIETRARRQKEMEQRREEYIKTLKEREEKLDEEMALRAVHLPQSVNIFTEQDEQFSKWEFEQKDKNEWETFLRCDPLPLPYDVPGLNTYLYLWREEENVFLPLEDKQGRIKEVLKLLNMIDDYLDNPVGATKRLISLMEEVRDDIRSELQLHLDMSSYVVLRQIDQMEGEGRSLGEPEVRRYKCSPSPDIALYLWAAVIPSSTTAFEPAPDSAYACDFPELGMHVQLPPHAVQPEEAGVPRPQLALRALHLAYDHYSSRCATNAQPHFPEEFTMNILEAMEKESEERGQQREETEAIVKILEREAGLRKASEAVESAPPPAEPPVRESQAYLFAPLTNKPFPDPRLDDLVDELEPEETDYLRTEDGRKFWEMMFMSERELVNMANEENFLEKVNSMKPPWAHSLKTKYDKRAEKYGVIIPPHSIAFGHRLDPERREVIQKQQLKSGPVLEDILASKERIRESEERGAEEEEGAGKGAVEASAPADDLVTKPAEVLFEESDAEYSESSEESLPVFQKIQRHKMAQKEEEDPQGGEGRKESRAVVLETESSSPGPSSYAPSSDVSETGESVQGETSTTLGSSDEEESESGSEYSTSDSDTGDATTTGATTTSEGEWSPSGEMDTSGSDEEGDVAWRKDWAKRKAKGGKKTSKKGSPKKGKKAGGKKKSPKKGSPGKKKKGKGKKKKGKKKGKKKKKKKSPKSSPLTPKTPEDPWLIEERDAVEREKEKEKEYVRELREKMAVVDLKQGELNLRRFAILGGVTHLDLLMHPPQPYQMYDSTITLTEIRGQPGLEYFPFYERYEPPPPPEPGQRRPPEEIEAELKKQEKELEKLALITIK